MWLWQNLRYSHWDDALGRTKNKLNEPVILEQFIFDQDQFFNLLLITCIHTYRPHPLLVGFLVYLNFLGQKEASFLI